MKFSVDEWGVWAVPSNTVNAEIDQKPWGIAPAISEQIYYAGGCTPVCGDADGDSEKCRCDQDCMPVIAYKYQCM